jgi:uncharacterized protein YndB with AHSA1/START domain
MADLQTANANTLTLRRMIAAPADRIFRAWTDPAQLKDWFSPSEAVTLVKADFDVREGGAYRITLIGPKKEPFSVTGIYREVRPYETLAFTWNWEDADLDIGETVVTVQLNDRGASTELVLTHERLPNAEKRDEHAYGWNGLLDALETYTASAE